MTCIPGSHVTSVILVSGLALAIGVGIAVGFMARAGLVIGLGGPIDVLVATETSVARMSGRALILRITVRATANTQAFGVLKAVPPLRFLVI